MSNNIQVVIVDDEPKMIELLEDAINDLYPQISIAGKYTNWKDAIKGINSINPDIIFMDISMPEKSGFDILNLLPEIDTEIIFVTAHSEYAVEAFEHAAAGYILKPINEIKLTKTVNRVLKKIEQKADVFQQSKSAGKIGIPDDDSVVYYNVEDILYIETVNRYTKIVTINKEIISSYSLGMYKKTLPAHLFLLVHRSFIINISHVTRLDPNNYVIMTNKKEIPLSKNHKDEFLTHFQKIGR
ncbi:MAG: LytTR family DNA-binding domain-containing protein [Flavipsychrobacter sp.]